MNKRIAYIAAMPDKDSFKSIKKFRRLLRET